MCHSTVKMVVFGRCAQVKQWGQTQGPQPKMSAEFLLYMLKNAASYTEFKSLDVDCLVTEHIQVNKALNICYHMYGTQDQINPCMSSTHHAKMIFTKKRIIFPKLERKCH